MDVIILALIVVLLALFRSMSPRTAKVADAEQPLDPTKTNARPETEIQSVIEHLPHVVVSFVKDGDTCDVVSDRTYSTIRLDSIDCPEDGQPWGDNAKYGLIKMIGGKTVRLEVHGVDAYGRTLATVYVRDVEAQTWINVNERMVTLGHAWVMWKYFDHLPKDRQEKLKRLETRAQSKKIGLWRDPNAIPPWLWRRKAP